MDDDKEELERELRKANEKKNLLKRIEELETLLEHAESYGKGCARRLHNTIMEKKAKKRMHLSAKTQKIKNLLKTY